jgi:hypothetical protein
VRKADNLTAICEPTVYKMWEPRRLTTLLASTSCYRDSFTFFTQIQGSWCQAGSPGRTMPVVRRPADLHGHVSDRFGLQITPVRVMTTHTELPDV